MTRERLEWQLRRFADGGIHNLVVINLAPAGPIFGAMADDPAWFSEEWWDRFGHACRIARELDQKTDPTCRVTGVDGLRTSGACPARLRALDRRLRTDLDRNPVTFRRAASNGFPVPWSVRSVRRHKCADTPPKRVHK